MKGSHNTLTYAGPARWWGWLCVSVWRCQRKNVREQIEAGCRAFDIRLSRNVGANGDDAEDMWVSAHGIVDLKLNPVAAIEEIARLCPDAYVRVTLEKERGADDREDFRRTCRWLEAQFPEMTFFNGRLKPGWVKLYAFKKEDGVEESLAQRCGSMSGTWWGKAWPWLWARLHGSEAVADESAIVLMDFV